MRKESKEERKGKKIEKKEERKERERAILLTSSPDALRKYIFLFKTKYIRKFTRNKTL